MQFKGDIGSFRAALLLAGFFGQSECYIYNDRRKDGTRRLKLQYATDVYEASADQHEALTRQLDDAFGSRIADVYFIPGSDIWDTFKQLCIVLRN